MKLTTKGRYAVTAMLDLALYPGPVSLADIAERQHISLTYLEQLFAQLRREGLVDSVRGPGGGYLLAKAPADVRVSDIIEAVSEQISMTLCGGDPGHRCKGEETCITHDLWEDLADRIAEFLQGVTLAQLVERQRTPKPVVMQDCRPGVTARI